MKHLADEQLLAGFLIIFSLFTWINVDPLIGGFYFAGVIVYYIALGTRYKEVEIFVRGQSLSNVVLAIGIILLVWTEISSRILSSPIITSTESAIGFFDKLGAFTNIPVLALEPSVQLAIFGIFIPVVESLIALSFILLVWASLLKVPIRWHSVKSPMFPKMLWVCILVGITMSFYHLAIRQVADAALIVDLLFFAISAFTVFASSSKILVFGGDKKPNMAKPLGFHLVVNIIVISTKLGLI